MPLGVLLTANGTQQAGLECPASEWADLLRTCRLSKNKATQAMRVAIISMLEYPLLATTFSHKQRDGILKHLLCAIVANTRIN